MSKEYNTTTGNELEYCPGCRYDKAELYRYRRKRALSAEEAQPQVAWDSLLKIRYIWCPVCQMRVIFGRIPHERIVRRWNNMVRINTYQTPWGPIPWDRVPRGDVDGWRIMPNELGSWLRPLVRQIFTLPHDGNSHVLHGTKIQGKRIRQRKSDGIRRYMTESLGWPGSLFHMSWRPHGLYFTWENDPELGGTPEEDQSGQ